MIEFFYFAGCPSYERALDELHVAMDELAIDRSQLTITEVVTDTDVERQDFPGSPTIRVNRRDVQDPGDLPRALTCRLYRHRDGRPSPLPDPQDLRDALNDLIQNQR